jgi:copper chaperone CopZ
MAKTRYKWNRLLVNPKTHVVSRDGELTLLQVDGLVCSSVCAVRTKQALAALPGVESVKVEFDTGIATIVGVSHDASTYEQAVTGAVAGKPLRRLIEAVAHRFPRRHTADA